MLATLEKRYGPKGFRVLGFPCNDFANEEPGDLPEIAAFCRREYGATYRLFDKVHCVGREIHPIYHWLTTQPLKPGKVEWNFAKFLIGRDGALVGRWAPATDPDSRLIRNAIDQTLKEPAPRD